MNFIYTSFLIHHIQIQNMLPSLDECQQWGLFWFAEWYEM